MILLLGYNECGEWVYKVEDCDTYMEVESKLKYYSNPPSGVRIPDSVRLLKDVEDIPWDSLTELIDHWGDIANAHYKSKEVSIDIPKGNSITVAFGDVPDKVLMFAVKDFALDIDLDEGEIDLTTVNDERTFAYYHPYEGAVPGDIVTNAISCLHDHINNVDESELKQRREIVDYMCANPAHTECYCSQDDCAIVTVYSFSYNAQDCTVEVYYVVEVGK